MTIEDFKAGLRENLDKIWNRMSSGMYFPPPVRAVENPKALGGTRFSAAHRGRQSGADSGLDGAGTPCGVDLPRSLLWLPAQSLGAGRRRNVPEAALEEALGDRSDIRKFFDSVPWDRVVKAVEVK